MRAGQRHDRAAGERRPRLVSRIVAAGVVLVGPLVALLLSAGPAGAASCTEPVAAGQIRVVIVVDPGDAGSPSSACLVVPAGTTGSQALSRRAAELGRTVPRYGGSGLLCALDGHPTSGCGDRNAGGYLYWAYFNGSSGSWVYGNYNPFIRRLADGDVEGWRFVDGAGNGSDPPPRIGPSRSLFPAIVTPTTVPVVEPAAPVTAPPAAPSTTAPVVESPEAAPTPSSSTTAATAAPSVELSVATVGSTSDVGQWLSVVLVGIVVIALGVGAFLRSRRRA